MSIEHLTTENPVVAMIVAAANEAEKPNKQSYEDRFREVFEALEKATRQASHGR